jgi:hypothetical protein|tara:strand:- start:27 stop:278 length:252 start_codon:yes stop_codon:yes gene_type:complete
MADFNYDKDHPKVQSLKKFINKNREEKGDKRGSMTDKEAKKLADKLETRTSKRVSKTEGSFKSGGPVCKLATKGKGRAYGKNS